MPFFAGFRTRHFLRKIYGVTFPFLDFYWCSINFLLISIDFRKKLMNRFCEKLATEYRPTDAKTSMNSQDLPCWGSKNNRISKKTRNTLKSTKINKSKN